MQGLLATLPFSNIPKQMKIKFIYFIVLWLTAFLVKTGISTTYSARELLVCWQLDYKKHCRVLPGSYCKVHDKLVPENTMVWQTHKGIALSLTGNIQGSMKFYCTNPGRVLKHCSFTLMPMPDQAIKRVNAIGAQEGQGHAFQFLNQSQDPYGWTDKVPQDDPDFQGLLDNKEEEAVYPDISAELPGVELEEDKGAYQTITNEPKDKFRDMAAVMLDNAGINPEARLCRLLRMQGNAPAQEV
jgi:hypothetical protein